jgi:cobyrinic acid a,c-diamide synthase
VVAVAGGRAFTFRYPETDELIRAAGCEPVIFDPLTDEALPEYTAGLYLGGGFPEVHAADLAGNTAMLESVRRAISAGMPTVAECAGLLYLCRSVDGEPMVGAVPAEAAMTPQLVLGYRSAVADRDHLLGAAGSRVRGHEFHRTAVTAVDQAPGWLVEGRPDGFSADPAHRGHPTVHASYLHLHWAGHPQIAQNFCDAVHRYAAEGSRSKHDDLDHHGDADLADGLVDLAVNVRVPAPPEWLVAVINASTPDLAAYPRPEAARAAVAAAHGLALNQVLPTAGAAEAFTLLARARRWLRPAVIHPQFTEPEAALRAAGYDPQRVFLDHRHGFRLEAGLVPDDADLVIIGNPTNPTSVLHPAASLRRLARVGRVLCVDEAFMDAVPDESESLVAGQMAGLVVLRSLTKTWGLAGLRAGYAVGDATVIADLRRQQPPWSVSTPALAVIAAALTPAARLSAQTATAELAEHREQLTLGLDEIGLPTVAEPRAPYVLVDTSAWATGRQPGWVRLALREQGFAVRRGETFPGLGPDWIRIAVRDPGTSRALIKALTVIREQIR